MEKRYGLIGEPIEHSLSPAMHNFWFKESGVSGDYKAYSVPMQELAETVERLKAIGIHGFNVTFPHKTAIMPLLDEVSTLAETIGAVNTVVQSNGRLIGYNTDGLGFLEGLKAHFPMLATQKPSVLIIGAGGAARSVALVLAQAIGSRIDICNRTFERALILSESCKKFCTSQALDFAQAEKQIDQYQIIINTTSLGLYPETDHPVIKIDGAASNTLFVDLIYHPNRTAFLKDAERLGYRVMNGLPMLVCQGALAFQKWTGVYPDTKKMEDYLIRTFLS